MHCVLRSVGAGVWVVALSVRAACALHVWRALWLCAGGGSGVGGWWCVCMRCLCDGRAVYVPRVVTRLRLRWSLFVVAVVVGGVVVVSIPSFIIRTMNAARHHLFALIAWTAFTVLEYGILICSLVLVVV